jgi:3-oxoacyl-[acyl-carrier-protein] synthase III
MIEYLSINLGISFEKYYLNIQKTGNTVKSTIPIPLKNIINDRTVKKIDKVIMAGFVVGYSWGATIIINQILNRYMNK